MSNNDSQDGVVRITITEDLHKESRKEKNSTFDHLEVENLNKTALYVDKNLS